MKYYDSWEVVSVRKTKACSLDKGKCLGGNLRGDYLYEGGVTDKGVDMSVTKYVAPDGRSVITYIREEEDIC